MRVADLIEKTRDGVALTEEEIGFLVRGFAAGRVPDYQTSAWMMAVCIKGLRVDEVVALTRAMVNSGEVIDLSPLGRPVADKHSTGGVGDKTTLVAAPLAAAAGVPVAKMSGRGLGHSGGTLDKLESVPGLRVELTAEEFVRQVGEVGLAIVGQTGDLVPADKMMYALRDVTGTVPSPALIASSVMSKKVAGGASAIVLDVKCGSGAFMKTEADAKRLARLMLTVGAAFGRSTRAIISDMDEPLGTAIGNACEVREAIETLRGGGPADLRALAIEIAAIMVHAADGAASLADARARVEDALTSGLGLERLAAMIEFQCGDASVVDVPNRLPRARVEAAVESERAGIVQRVDALQVGRAAMLAGAGRENKDQKVDPGAGVVLSAVRGDSVSSGDAVAVVFGSDEARARAGAEALRSAYRIGDAAPPARQFVFKEVAGDSA